MEDHRAGRSEGTVDGRPRQFRRAEGAVLAAAAQCQGRLARCCHEGVQMPVHARERAQNAVRRSRRAHMRKSPRYNDQRPRHR